jgi:hypothetical protein
VVATDVACHICRIPRPIQIQSQPFNGKTRTYIKAVHGAKTRLAMPTSQGKLKVPKAVFTRRGAISQKIRKARRGPKIISDAKKQHIGYSFNTGVKKR